MKLVALALSALLIAAPAAAQSGSYHATGTEPFWSLDIVTRGSIVFKDQGTGLRIVTATPTARPSFNGRRYVTRRITIDITRTKCSDGMSERSYPDTVTVSIGRRIYRGCGGEPMLDAALLDGSRWRITSLDGRAIKTSRPTQIRFEGERIAGNAGCNSFGGNYRIERGALIADRVIATKMACMGTGMQVEVKFFAIIRGPARVTMNGRTMALAAPAGTVVLTRAD